MNSKYMKRALELSKLGYGFANPNPIVGAVIVKDNEIIGEGYHRRYGELHAERNAIADAIERGNEEFLEGATMYVTLEPCSHWGKTPPCTEAIIQNKIGKVYVSCVDSNPNVQGRGIDILRNAGIEVNVGLMKEEVWRSNEIFFKYHENKKPFVILKAASSLDGKIATASGESKWITGEEARKHVHIMRNRVMGIMVGVNTVIQDNPLLNVRGMEGEVSHPIRIVLDTHGRIPLNSRLLKDKSARNIIAVGIDIGREKLREIKKSGAEVLVVKTKAGKIDMSQLIYKLGDMNIDSILIEGGGEVHFSAIESGIVDKVMMYIAPMIIGGRDAKTSIEGNGIMSIDDTMRFKESWVERIGEDFLFQGYVE